jgi:hypothetical protein
MARKRTNTKSSTTLSMAIPGLSLDASIAFKEQYVITGLLDRRDFISWQSRLGRYSLFWAFYEGTAYSDAHRWSADFRKAFGLYAWARNVFNVAFRLGEFWAAHLMGGALDPAAGDGRSVPSALPIGIGEDGDADIIRRGIARLWADSNWQTKKEIWTRWGAVLGDVFLMVVDDPIRRKIYLRPISPAAVRYVEYDPFGNIKGYIIEEPRPDPEAADDATGIAPWARYTEICTKDGEEITFETYRNSSPYDWTTGRGEGDPDSTWKWTKNYGFVPMVGGQHLNVGAEGGWAEFQPALPMVREIDDLTCVLTDQARRILNSPWVMNAPRPSEKLFNAKAKAADEMSPSTSGTTEVVGRDRMQLIWIDPKNNDGKGIQPYQLVGNMPIDAVGGQIDRLVRNLEKFYPELLIEGETTGDSGRARRVARQKAEAKVHSRRAGYDDALIRAHMMALSMGGTRRGKPTAYPDYEGIEANSYEDGDLSHTILKRSVFAKDPMDDTEEEQAIATVLRTYKEAGVPVSLAMRRNGFEDKDVEAQEKREQQAEDLAKSLAAAKARPAGVAPQSPDGPKPVAQESTAAQNRGANAPTDLQNELYARPGVPFETRQTTT